VAGGRRVEKQVYCARESTRVASDHEGGGHDPLPITRNPPPPSSMCKLSRAGGGQRREQLKEVGSATNRTKRRRDRKIVTYSTTITSLTKFYMPPIRTITAIALTAKGRRSGTPTYRAGNSFFIVFVLMLLPRETAALVASLADPRLASRPLYPPSGEDLHIDDGGRGFTPYP
jgi:hypothetical protein